MNPFKSLLLSYIAPKVQRILAQGNALGMKNRPNVFALKGQHILNRIIDCPYRAFIILLPVMPRTMPWAKLYRPFRPQIFYNPLTIL